MTYAVFGATDKPLRASATSGDANFSWVDPMFQGENNTESTADRAREQLKHSGNESKMRYSYWNPKVKGDGSSGKLGTPPLLDMDQTLLCKCVDPTTASGAGHPKLIAHPSNTDGTKVGSAKIAAGGPDNSYKGTAG